jgi:hypothetical protein
MKIVNKVFDAVEGDIITTNLRRDAAKFILLVLCIPVFNKNYS